MQKPVAPPLTPPAVPPKRPDVTPLVRDRPIEWPPPVDAIVLLPAEVQELGAALSANLLSKDDLIARVKAMTQISVDGVAITLEEGLLHRLKSRCFDGDFPSFLRSTVTDALHAFVGW